MSQHALAGSACFSLSTTNRLQSTGGDAQSTGDDGLPNLFFGKSAAAKDVIPIWQVGAGHKECHLWNRVLWCNFNNNLSENIVQWTGNTW